MAVELTENARILFEGDVIQPQLVLQFEGISTLYGAREINKKIRYGDEGLVYGGGEVYGGSTPIEDQEPIVSFQDGTSTNIRQTLNPDKGSGSSISNLTVALVDLRGKATELITPGEVIEDLMGVKVNVWYGPIEGNWKDDFFIIFRGHVDFIDSASGLVTLKIAHPDSKRRTEIFTKGSDELDGAIDASTTTVVLGSTASFLEPILGPDLINDPAIEFFVRIDDELIQYTSLDVDGVTLTGVTRGALTTTAASHSDEATVESFIRLNDNAIDMALKLMLSGWNGPYREGLTPTSFNLAGETGTVANSIFFRDINVEQEYGFVKGDYVSTSGAINAANDFTLKTINTIVATDDGSYMVIDGVTLVNEDDSTASLDVRSQYDTFPDGLKMGGEEVDVTGHIEARDFFVTDFDYDIYIKDSIENTKEFIDETIYLPFGGFSVPRRARASVNIHSPPIPGEIIKTVSSANVLNPADLRLKRTTNKNFYNAISYKFEELQVEDRFIRGVTFASATSLARIKVGKKVLTVPAKGLRVALNALNITNTVADRLLKKYKFGAEYIDNVKVNFETGVNMEIGDIVVFDFNSLQISDIQNASRSGEARLMQIENWRFDLGTGRILLSLVDTSFDKDQRRGLIAPCSQIKSGISNTQFVIEQVNPVSKFGVNEYKKWENFIGCGLRIRSKDYTVFFDTFLKSVAGNTITVEDDLGFTPPAEYLMELSKYDNQPDVIKLRYAFMRETGPFNDGKVIYTFF